MSPVFHRLLFWSARVLSIALIGLLSLFALDVFQEYHGFGKVLVALAIHLIPTFLLLAISLVAWRREWLGALLFAAAGAGVAGTAVADVSATVCLAELRPSEKPTASEMPHRITSPKKSVSNFPMPSVISVSLVTAAIVSCSCVIITPNYAPVLGSASVAGGVDFGAGAINFWMPASRSMGTGKMTVVFFSTPISVSV